MTIRGEYACLNCDDWDFEKHVDDIHWNPVKHGYVMRVADWRYSTFHRFVTRGMYPLGWVITPRVVPSVNNPDSAYAASGLLATISMFYGILIRMSFYATDKHHVPHIHAEYQGQVAVYAIHDGAVLAGELPPKKHKLVVAWIEIHHDDLHADWQLAVVGKKPFQIRGLDQ